MQRHEQTGVQPDGPRRRERGRGRQVGRRGASIVGALLLACASIVSALLLACTSNAPSPGDAPTHHPTATAEELLVVDCLLPGQLRKIGSRFNYLTKKRPVKTSAVDCEVRGGEYVAFDRANYATSLAVWLPAAEGGDAEAQNYVGEIFERGLGRSADYETAADWYRRAAEQGYAPAQINLGQLYEQGLGVEADVAQALHWYERAAGLEGGSWELVASPELASLREQLEVSTAEARALRDELSAARRQIEEVRSRRASRETAAARAQDAVAQERAGLAEERRRLALESERIAAAEAALERRDAESQASTADRARLAARTDALEAREAEIEGRFQDLAAMLAEVSRVSHELEIERDRLRVAKPDPASDGGDTRRRLAERERQLAEQQAQLAERTERLEQQQRELARERGSLEAIAIDRGALGSYAAELEQREQGLRERAQRLETRAQALDTAEAGVKQQRGEIAALNAEIERLRADAEAQRQQLAALDEQPGPSVALAGPDIQMIDPVVVATRSARSRGLRTMPVAPGVEKRLVVGRVEAPAGLLSLTVNDRDTGSDPNGLFQTELPIARDGTEVKVVAVDRQGERAVLQFVLMSPDAREAAARSPGAAAAPARLLPDVDFGRYFALVIGNNEYQHLPDLQSAINDADAVSSVLTERYGFQVTDLRDASRYEILSALNELTARLKKTDNLVVYYAGHGELDRVNQVGHWLPVDAERDSSANWLSTRSLTDQLNRMKARHVLVVADSCYAGALTRSAVTRLKTGEVDEERKAWVRAQLGLRVRAALTSGGLAPVLDTGDGKHSLFARSFLDVLRANDGVLDGLSLYQAISARVVQEARDRDFDQLPEYAPIRYGHHENGHFLFVPRA